MHHYGSFTGRGLARLAKIIRPWFCPTLFSPRHAAHSKTVRGVAIDALTMEVYSGSADCTVKVSGKGMGCGYRPLGCGYG